MLMVGPGPRAGHAALVAVVALAVLVGAPAAQGWAMAGGEPGRSGHDPDAAVGTGARAWSYPHEGDYTRWTGSAAIAGGVVYAVQSRVGTSDAGGFERGPGRLVALDAALGDALWRTDVAGAVHASPLVVGDAVVVMTTSGGVQAVQRSDGAVRWVQEVQGAIMDPLLWEGRIVASAAASGVYALDASDGAVVWHWFPTSPVAPVALLVSDRDGQALPEPLVLAPEVGGNLTALHVSDGSVAWRVGLGHPFVASPATTDGLAFLVSADGQLMAVDATGAVAWSRAVGRGAATSPAVADGRVFVAAGSDGVHAFDAETGAPAWSYSDVGGSAWAPVVGGGRVYVATQQLVALEGEAAPTVRPTVLALGAHDGRPAWRFLEEAGRLSLGDGRLVVAGTIDLVAFDTGAGIGGAVDVVQARPLLPEPAFPKAGERFTLPVRVSNVGDVPGEVTVTLLQDGRQVGTRTLSLWMGNSTTIAFEGLKAKEGNVAFEVRSSRDPDVHPREVVVLAGDAEDTPVPTAAALAAALAGWAAVRRRQAS